MVILSAAPERLPGALPLMPFSLAHDCTPITYFHTAATPATLKFLPSQRRCSPLRGPLPAWSPLGSPLAPVIDLGAF